MLGGLGQATLSFFAVATLLFFFFCECPKFCDLAKQRRKIFVGFLRSEKTIFRFIFSGCASFSWFFIFLLLRARILRPLAASGDVLDQGLKELGYSREDLNVELFASNKRRVQDLYCSKGNYCCYKFYWPSFGMAYGNPRFSELGMVLTKVALERSCMVLCSPDLGARGGNEYWRTLLEKADAHLHPAAG